VRPEEISSEKVAVRPRLMPEAIKAGATCIDRQKGIAHHVPKEPEAAGETEKK
jgi:nitrate/TMAO reductase-like tetraheme cytochrome c subunit